MTLQLMKPTNKQHNTLKKKYQHTISFICTQDKNIIMKCCVLCSTNCTLQVLIEAQADIECGLLYVYLYCNIHCARLQSVVFLSF